MPDIKVKIDHPSFEKGEMISGVGGFIGGENGTTVTVDEETQDLIKSQLGMTLREALKDHESLSISGDSSSSKGGDKS